MNTKRKKLTISIMCSGRADTTEKCLQSLNLIRKELECELLITDTGCSEETRIVIEKYADKIIDYTWNNDFAEARNIGLKAAQGEWFMFLDDDEYFEESSTLIKMFKSAKINKYSYGVYYVRNYTNFEGTAWNDSEALRIIKITPEIHFEGKVHEHLTPLSGNAFIVDSYVGHFGYVYKDDEEYRNHCARNINLLHKAIEEEPCNCYYPSQLLIEYRGLGYWGDLKELSKKYIELITFDEKYKFEKRFLGNFYCGLLLSLFCMNEISELEEEYSKTISNTLIDDFSRAELAAIMARAYFALSEYEKCKEVCLLYINLYEKYANDRTAKINLEGPFTIFTFDATCYNYVFCYAATISLMEKKWAMFDKYNKKIEFDLPQIELSKGYVEQIIVVASKENGKKELVKALENFTKKEGLTCLLLDILGEKMPEMSEDELGNVEAYFETINLVDKYKIKKASVNNNKLFEEMKNLEEGVCQQIQELLSKGMIEEAKEAKWQLESIIMKNFGVKSLINN